MGEKGPIYQPALQSTRQQLQCNIQIAIHRRRHPEAANQNETIAPSVQFGLIASGDSVIKFGLDRDATTEQEDVIAFEMEGVEVWDP